MVKGIKRKGSEKGNDKPQPPRKLTITDYRVRKEAESPATPPPTPNQTEAKEFNLLNNEVPETRQNTITPPNEGKKEDEHPETTTTDPEPSEQNQINETPPVTPPPINPIEEEEYKSASPALTEGEVEEPPTPIFKIGICLKALNLNLQQEDLDAIRLTLLQATLDTPLLAHLEVTTNITDLKGNKIIIKSKNYQTIQLVRDIMSTNDRFTTIIDEDIPGLRVKLLLPAWMKVFVEKEQILKLITIHHPTLSADSFKQYQPNKNLENGGTLVYYTLDYKAQLYFAGMGWRINLLGSTLSISDPDKRDRSAPDISSDLGNVSGLGINDSNTG